MKKVLIPVLLLLFIIAALAACSKNQNEGALTVEQFRQKAEAAGYRVEDMEITPEDQEEEPGLTACLAFLKDTEEGFYHAGHFKIFNSAKNAGGFYDSGKNDLGEMEQILKADGNDVPGSSLEDNNFAYFTRSFTSIEDDPFYAAILRRGKTTIDVMSSAAIQEEMEQFLRDLGYL
ncbi:MAG: hypothetical protein LBB91_01565 [Clostridiales bacterium]|nr:hypothetical protein [Clostridiales bacterium]